jgi:hypothetical protein
MNTTLLDGMIVLILFFIVNHIYRNGSATTFERIVDCITLIAIALTFIGGVIL